MHEAREVVVVGGGPAGLYTAHLLAAQGVDVLVLDARRAIGEHVVCTGIVSKEGFSRLGFSRSSILSEIQKLRLVSPAGSCLHYTHPEVLAYAVDRNKFDNEIRERAEKSGAEVRLRSTVKRVAVSNDRAQVVVRSADRNYNIRAGVVVIATGVRYRLQHPLGLGVPGKYLRAAQAHLPLAAEPDSPTTVYVGQAVAPGGFAWAVPLNNGLSRVGLMTEGDVRQHFKRLLGQLGLEESERSPRVDFKPIAQGMATKSYANRVLAVGEAAGQTKTTTGGGIFYGLLGAEVAARVLGQALKRRDLSEKSLREYDQRWKQLMGREIKLGSWARRLAARLSDNEIERAVQAVQGDGFFAFAQKHARFDWHREAISYLLGMPDVRVLLHRPSGS